MANLKQEANEALLGWALKIDSSLHPELQMELRDLKLKNAFQSAFGTTECIPVGSCVEDSKVNIKGDIGDIDALLISGKVILKEELFEYVPDYPAFLTIPNVIEQWKEFQSVKLVEHKYLPVGVIKDIHPNLFEGINTLVRRKSTPKLDDDKTLKITKESAVGIEVIVLDGISRSKLGLHYTDTEDIYSKLLCETGCVLNRHLEMAADMFSGEQITQDTEFLAQDCDKMDRIRRKMKGENVGSTLYRIGSSIKTEVKQLKTKFFEDDPLSFEQTEKEKKLNTCGRAGGFSNEPYSKLIYEIDDEDIIERYENNFDEVSQLEEEESLDIVDEQPSTKKRGSWQDLEVNDGITSKGVCSQEKSKAKTKDVLVKFSKKYSIDFVPAFKINDWPRPAEEWKARKRKWPTMKVIHRVLETGCQVVVKHLPYMTTDENVKHFRLSFAMGETILAKHMCEGQKLVWKILKAYQKAQLCSKPKVLASYHWKNVVFWVSETKSEDFWQEDNILMAVNESLDFMIGCLRNKFLPQYFVNSMNLLADCDSETLGIVQETVIAIRERPELYLKKFITNPPRPRKCRVTREELQQVQDNDDMKRIENQNDDLLNVAEEIMKSLNDYDHFEENYSRFIDGTKEFVTEIKNQFRQNRDEKGKTEKQGTKLLCEIFDTLTDGIEIIDPRKKEIDSVKHMTNATKLTIRTAFMGLKKLKRKWSEKKQKNQSIKEEETSPRR